MGIGGDALGVVAMTEALALCDEVHAALHRCASATSTATDAALLAKVIGIDWPTEPMPEIEGLD